VDPSSFGGSIHLVRNNAWSEGSVTWNSSPVHDSGASAAFSAVASGSFYEIDISSLVTGNGTLSLALVSTNADGADYVSSEGTAEFVPRLTVVSGG
jgi:hypothetical protein